jgi:hypothetical protein
MFIMYLRAVFQILRFEYFIVRGNFPGLYRRVKSAAAPAPTFPPPETADLLTRAIDLVCLWYPKPVLCLQRSAATACLLKRYGIPARLMIGVQQLPFRAHSWVEVEGRVINDRPYVRDSYTVMDCC